MTVLPLGSPTAAPGQTLPTARLCPGENGFDVLNGWGETLKEEYFRTCGRARKCTFGRS